MGVVTSTLIFTLIPSPLEFWDMYYLFLWAPWSMLQK